jgi:small subunit ribosomal protein S17
MSETTTNKRTLVGRVVSDKMDKTVTVVVERRVKHAMYNKIIVRSSKYHAHNDDNRPKPVIWWKFRSLVRCRRPRPGSSPNLLERAVAV